MVDFAVPHTTIEQRPRRHGQVEKPYFCRAAACFLHGTVGRHNRPMLDRSTCDSAELPRANAVPSGGKSAVCTRAYDLTRTSYIRTGSASLTSLRCAGCKRSRPITTELLQTPESRSTGSTSTSLWIARRSSRRCCEKSPQRSAIRRSATSTTNTRAAHDPSTHAEDRACANLQPLLA